jgi:hypothetical protein
MAVTTDTKAGRICGFLLQNSTPLTLPISVFRSLDLEANTNLGGACNETDEIKSDGKHGFHFLLGFPAGGDCGPSVLAMSGGFHGRASRG